MFAQLFKNIQRGAANDFTLFGLRMFITLWAVFVIILAWSIENKLILGGMIAYEVLP